MADIHILTGSGNKWNAVLHIAVPDANNTAGVNWRTAILRSGVGGGTVLPDGDGNDGTISAAEKAQIEAGEIYEHSVQIPLEGNGSVPAVVQAVLRSHYTNLKTTVIADIQSKLKYYGHTESET